MMFRWPALASCALAALAACHAPTVPDFTYYRLPPPQPPPAAAPLSRQPLVVDAFGADGVYADQALVYALDAQAQQLRQYHYQLWADVPTRLLQRRLIARLRATQAAPRVTDEEPASTSALRIGGTILRLDRVPNAAGGWHAVVTLKLRATAPDGTLLLDDYYHADQAAAGGGVLASVDAFGAAVDEIFAKFEADLRQHGGLADAR